eukprot:3596151-Pyramimonas_sp.AAC.1
MRADCETTRGGRGREPRGRGGNRPRAAGCLGCRRRRAASPETPLPQWPPPAVGRLAAESFASFSA